MSTGTRSLQLDDLTIQVVHEGDTVTMTWFGTSEIQAPAQSLSPFLMDVITGLQGQNVVVDFRAVEYLNSATLWPVLQMLRALNDRQLSTKVLFDPTSESQRTTYRCLQTIGTSLPKISIVGD